MRWSVECERTHGWVVITHYGRLTRQDCIQATHRSLELMAAGAPQGFLVDIREAVSELGAGDIYAIPAMWTHGNVHRASAVALVVSAASANPSDTEFFENTCRNRGWNVSVFDAYDLAVSWLASQPGVGDASVSA